MRNPERIDGFCQRLTTLWQQVPDWRFGQLIANLMPQDPISFYMEDDKMIKTLEENLNKMMNKGE